MGRQFEWITHVSRMHLSTYVEFARCNMHKIPENEFIVADAIIPLFTSPI